MSVDLQKVTDLAGEIPTDNIDDAKAVLENFCTNNIAVLITNKDANITHGTHYHQSYEFGICHSKLPSTIIDNKLYNRSCNELFAVNPMQEHGLTMNLKGFNLCGIHIDKNYMQNAAIHICGSSNIVFSNESFMNSHDISMLIRLFLEELKYKQLGYEFIVENLSLLIVGNLIRQINNNLPSIPHNIPKSNKENIKKVIDYMNENFTIGITCSELSKLMNIDKFSFIRNFKAQTGKTPYEYILDLKIEKAKKMLKSNKYNITEISMMCGFSSHSHFTSTFKKKTGISPTEYKTSL